MFKNRFVLISICFLLSSCAGAYTQQAQTQINSMMERESAAWKKTEKLKTKECPNGTKAKPMPKSKAVEKHECWAKLVRENVSPAAIAPDLLMTLITGNKQVAIDYKKGRIDRDEANLGSEKLWNEYYTALVTRATEAYKHAQQQDQALAQRFQKASQVIQAQEEAQQRALDNSAPPTNTTCNVWNNQIDCTRW